MLRPPFRASLCTYQSQYPPPVYKQRPPPLLLARNVQSPMYAAQTSGPGRHGAAMPLKDHQQPSVVLRKYYGAFSCPGTYLLCFPRLINGFRASSRSCSSCSWLAAYRSAAAPGSAAAVAHDRRSRQAAAASQEHQTAAGSFTNRLLRMLFPARQLSSAAIVGWNRAGCHLIG